MAELKVKVFGDVHGRDYSEQWSDIDKFDYFIFLGDYFDSFDIPYTKQAKSFFKIIRLKKNHPDKVILLIGNHDTQYIFRSTTPGIKYHLCTGHQMSKDRIIHYMFLRNLNLFQYCFELKCKKNHYIFTHAGISSKLFNIIKRFKENYPEVSISEFINSFGDSLPAIHYCSIYNGGKDPFDGLLWIRPGALLQDRPENIIQVIGHTHVKYPITYKSQPNKNNRVHLLDNGKGNVLKLN